MVVFATWERGERREGERGERREGERIKFLKKGTRLFKMSSMKKKYIFFLKNSPFTQGNSSL